MVDEREHYRRTMDAITSRKPERVNANCLEMLRAKVLQLETPELFNEALAAYRELEARADGALLDCARQQRTISRT